ncbi:glycosyltransferase family 4 protein [Butyrivibrio sp. VCB2006]|uniref:glycosyltransferase family 4 protein n=1 Tax=Butyrivibrio sp. VCB2006 TaxID=1280679 RepID=UPI0003FDC1E4|nr:glycosyltransferase family 4 protein [Butyrivibrio sp. VCB2006]
MVVTFVSNYINHHQLPFCNAMDAMEDVEFHFIQTSPMEEKRVQMGWGMDPSDISFVSLYYQDEEKCRRLILGSDVTILGWSDGLIADLEKERLSSGRLTFRVSERIYREGQWKAISPRGLASKYNEHVKYRKKPVYLLCAGAYVASDFDLIGSYPGKKLKWGYFPQQEISEFKKPELGNAINICWAGRIIELKHCEYAIEVAKLLSDKGYDYHLDIVGDGNKRADIESLIDKYGLKDKVTMHGSKKPKEVLEFMQRADVFLFTSNYLEGWGAVVNEAMQSGCAVVASREAGSVPYLIQDGINGLSYGGGSLKALESKVLYLFENRDKIREFGERAKETITRWWNAENGAEELVRFSREALNGKEPEPSAEGPMSVAPNLKPAGLIRTMQEKNRLE